jgi:hypothetical protein
LHLQPPLTHSRTANVNAPCSASVGGRDGWLASLRGLVPVPVPHREAMLDTNGALRILRCGEDTFAELLAEGFAHEQRDGTAWFDRFDIFNLGLHSRSGRSLPELTIGFLARLAREERSGLIERRGWQAQVQLRCPDGGACAPGCEWSFGLPKPDVLGGRLTGLNLPQGAHAEGSAIMSSGPAESFGFAAALITVGQAAEIHSRALRDEYRSVLGEFRFQIMPRALKMDVEQIVRLGVADCDGVSVVLADACARAGYEAHVQYGFLLGPFGFGHHTWVRVRDSDGELKTLEPTLPIVSALGGEDTSAFADFCCGSTLNRVVTCETPAAYLAEHVCVPGRLEPEVVIRVRPDPAQLDEGGLP